MTTSERVMSLPDAEALAERTLAAIERQSDAIRAVVHDQQDYYDRNLASISADRERVASDLDGLREHVPTLLSHFHKQGCQAHDDYGYVPVDWPCSDVCRYSDGLLRTAALYGVAP